jgi:uncharacterized membrane protein YjgN (DUF898 family)
MDTPATSSVPSVGPSSTPKTRLDIQFENRGDRLIGLGFVNGALRVMTLGLYSFWAKTEVRRKLWSFVRLNGEPLEYTGTGKELFLGFLIVFGAFVIPTLLAGVAVALVFAGNPTAFAIYQAAIYILFFLLIGNAMYRAQRYRLSRTRWRGIRGALVGSPGGYGWMYFWTLALPVAVIAGLAFIVAWMTRPAVGGGIVAVGVVIGLWVLPWRANALQRRLTREMRFGDAPLTYDGGAGPLYQRYLIAWLGSALTLAGAVAATFGWAIGADTIQAWRDLRIPPAPQQIAAVVGIWIAAIVLIAIITAAYRAAQVRHFARSTHLGAAQFRSDVGGAGLAWLIVSNWTIAALGILIGVIVGGALIFALGGAQTQTSFSARPEATMAQIALALAPIVVFSTAATTFAQFRSARYFASRLKLDGDVDIAAIQQSADQGLTRGEGLAQVFDLDAL